MSYIKRLRELIASGMREKQAIAIVRAERLAAAREQRELAPDVCDESETDDRLYRVCQRAEAYSE